MVGRTGSLLNHGTGPLKTHLTKRAADRLVWNPAGPATQIVWDESTEGFGARLYPSGRKTWVVSYRTTSGTLRIGALGATNVVTVENARRRATRIRSDALDGKDPLRDRRTKREAPSVRAFSKLYLEQHARKHKKSWRHDERRLDRWVLPAIGSKKLEDVTRADVARLHARIGESAPVEANRVLALVSVLFSKAGEWGYLPDGHANPASKVRSFGERSRDRWVTPEELPRLVQAIEAEDNPFVRAAITLAVFSGMRRGEILALKWDDADFDRAEIKLRDTKAGRSHVVPLVPSAALVLRQLPRMLGNPYVFASARRVRTHMVTIKTPWKRVRQRAGLEDVTFHDLRRTVGSWLAGAGVGLPVIGKVLNHSQPSTTAIYARIADTAAREALALHEKLVNTVLEAERRRA